MCNAYNLKTRLHSVGEALRGQLGLDLALPGGITAETSNLPVPEAVYPKKDGLFLRRAFDAGSSGLEPVIGRWGLVPFNHRGPLKAVKFPCNNARSETMAGKWPFKE
ncbi:MAG TPA: hypothetical protein PLO65_16690, partial [Caulobacter sp.]|nr:hypothetical protein [Caulobacter sp.]